jgi:beta-lactamase superfamily II metal-dependent hydrolase
VQRYVRRGIMIYRTDDSGAITARVDADGMQLTRWRETRPRYWHGR